MAIREIDEEIKFFPNLEELTGNFIFSEKSIPNMVGLKKLTLPERVRNINDELLGKLSRLEELEIVGKKEFITVNGLGRLKKLRSLVVCAGNWSRSELEVLNLESLSVSEWNFYR